MMILINKMKDDMHKETGINQNEIKVIATGGLSEIVNGVEPLFDHVDRNLSLIGLNCIYNLNNK